MHYIYGWTNVTVAPQFTPLTQCEKVPVEICGPAGCGFLPGPEECHEETKAGAADRTVYIINGFLLFRLL